MEAALEKSAMRKIYLRLLPFAVLSYVLAYIDRINVSFAGLTMRGDLKLSATEFGFALGTFYLGYFIFEVPSNVIMEKVGARIWIARIMITWGIFAGAAAFVYDTTSFSIVRFLLGVAEAGFFPGMLLYFTYWFPRRHHARIVSGFLVGLPIAVALGAPISTGLLGLDGMFGLRGWQIMYIAEAIPTVIVGLITLLVLTDRPAQASFLTAEEKGWLAAKLASERPPTVDTKFGAGKVFVLVTMYVAITVVSLGLLYYTPQITAWLKANFADVPPVAVVLIPYVFGTIGLLVWGRVADHHLWKAMINAKVLLLAVNYFGIVTASLGMLFFIPQIIKSLGNFSNMEVGWLTMIPYICGGIGMVVWGRVSDAMNERRWNSARCLRALDRRPRARRLYDGYVVGAGGNVDCRSWVLRLQGAILRHAADVPQWHGARCRVRVDQLDRQSRWHRRPVLRGLYEGPNRQLRRRPLRPGAAEPHRRAGVCVLPAHPRADCGGRRARCGRRAGLIA